VDSSQKEVIQRHIKWNSSGSNKGEQHDSNNIIPHVESITNNLYKHLSYYSDTWGKSITNNIERPYLNVDFSTALAIVVSEYRRIGVFAKLEELKDLLKTKVMQLDKNNFPYTLQIYGIINQLIKLWYPTTMSISIPYDWMIAVLFECKRNLNSDTNVNLSIIGDSKIVCGKITRQVYWKIIS